MLLREIQKTPKQVIEAAQKAAQAMLTEADGEEDKGNLDTVGKLSEWIAVYNNDLKKSLEAEDIRSARLHMIELAGAVKQMEDHVNQAAAKIGLPEVS